MKKWIKRISIVVISVIVLLVAFFVGKGILDERAAKRDALLEVSQEFNDASGDEFEVTEESSEEVVELPPPKDYELTLMMVGDNLLHMGIINTGQQADGSYNYDILFEGIAEYLAIADIKMINQETIFGGNDRGFSGYPAFNSPTQVGDAMVKAGFNVVLHSSNHTADKGLSGIQNCLAFWEQYPDMKVVGMHNKPEVIEEVMAEAIIETNAEEGSAEAIAEESSAEAGTVTEGEVADGTDADTEGTEEITTEAPASLVLMEVEDITFAFLNYTYGPNLATFPKSVDGYMDMLCDYDEETRYIDFTKIHPKVLEDIAYAETVADFTIVCPHWGTEYTTKPSSYQRDFARQMTEAGADLLLGTHPHVVQPMEWVEADNGNKALCYYSLGNYVSTQQKPLTMLEAMAWVTFHVTDDGITIKEDKTGVLPLVNHYVCPPVRFEKVYLLEEYSQELADRHGILNYGGVSLSYSDLTKWADEVFGENIMTRAQILGIEEEVTQEEETSGEAEVEETGEAVEAEETLQETAEAQDAA